MNYKIPTKYIYLKNNVVIKHVVIKHVVIKHVGINQWIDIGRYCIIKDKDEVIFETIFPSFSW